MDQLITSGRAIDAILVLVCIEAVMLALWRRRTGRGPATAALLPTLLSGAALLVAVRLALAEAWWGWLAAALSVALLAHLFDLGVRWEHA